MSLSQLSIISTSTNSIISTVRVGTEPHSLTASPDGLRIYVANYLSNSVSVIDLSTKKVIRTISLHYQDGPLDLACSPDGNLLYIANHRSGLLKVIDTRTFRCIRVVGVGSNLWGIAIHPLAARQPR